MSKNLVEILKLADAAKVNPTLLGRHGIGKTAITKGLEAYGYGIVTLIASQLDPTTVGGFPTKVPLEDGGYKMIYAVPDFIVKLRDIAAAGLTPLLFLDEFNRGDRYVENAFMTLVLDKEINGHKLPENTFVVAAMNPEADDDLGVSELTAPMMDRFAWLIVEPETNDWLKWAKGAGVNAFVTDYIHKEKDALTGFPFTEEMKANYLDRIKPTPRSWDGVGRILDASTDEKGNIVNRALAFELIRGLIGNEHTLALETHINNTDLRKFTVTEILEADDAVIGRVKDLIERNQGAVILASLEDAHVEIAKKFNNTVDDAAVATLGNLDKGFAKFITAVPVDIAATFFAIEDEYEQFFTNLLVKDDFPEEVVDLLVG
jgi:hypothetical protein